MRVHDLTRVLSPATPVYPGDPAVRFYGHAHYADHGYRVSEVRLGTHAGTHVDAPSHFLPGGAAVDSLPLEALIGLARVLEVAGEAPVVSAGERILVRSDWGLRWGARDYFTLFPPLPPRLLEQILSAPAALVGVDTPSLHPEPVEDARLHRLLLEAGVVILENLANLEQLPESVFLAALPLPLHGLDGSPCRAVAMDPETLVWK